MEHVPFAFWLVDVLRPISIVELGTWQGMSYLSFCQAVKAIGYPAVACAVDTWTGDVHAGWLEPKDLETLRAIHDPKYGSFSTLKVSTFDDALDDVEDKSVDLLHIDGLHTYEAVRHDFETWRPKVSGRGIVLFHDTREFRADFGVHRLWAEVSAGKPHFEFHHGHGLGVLGVGSNYPEELEALFAMTGDVEEAKLARNAFWRLGRTI